MPVNSLQYIPAYEHGYNIDKVHQLVFGKDPMVYYDITLFQTLDNKQYIINQEKGDSEIVAIAHPELRNAYTKKDMEKLSGYDMLEVLSNEKIATRAWDEALSSGKAAWIIADDDCHDISRPADTGVSWTMVNADTKKCTDVMQALRSGRSYGVKGSDGMNDHYLKDVRISGTNVTFVAGDAAQEIRLVGQDGVVKEIQYNVDSISYNFQSTDTYIRAVITFPSQTLYLNPIIRYDGKQIPRNINTASVNLWITFFIRAFIVTTWIFGMVFVLWPPKPAMILQLLKKRKARIPSPVVINRSGL